MKKKKIEMIFLGVLFLTIIVLIVLIIPKDIYFNLVEEKKTITMDTFYNQNMVKACYGNKFFVSHCEDISDKINVVGTVDSTKPGNYVIVYSVDYHGIKKEFTQKVTVIDGPPIIDLLGEKEVIKCPNNKIIEPRLTVYDKQDGNIQDKINKKINGDKYEYRVVDSFGNETVAYRKIIPDRKKPKIELYGGDNILLSIGAEYKEPGYHVTDNCSENLQDKVLITNNVDTSKIGTYLITYDVSDEAGNRSIVERKIVVVDEEIITNSEELITKPNNGKKTIYLTYDDGPNANTELILDVLKKYDVKATFFVTGQFPKYEYVLKRIHNEGHTIGLHTYSHRFKTIYASEENFFEDLNKVQEMVKRQTGTETKFMRFAGGTSNRVSKFNRGIMTRLDKLVAEKGFRNFDWNVDSNDIAHKNSSKIANTVLNFLSGRNNIYIVLQHDIKPVNVAATEIIIKEGLKRGYTFAPITDETPQIKHRVNN